MKWQVIVRWFIGLSVLIILGFDLFVVVHTHSTDASISHQIILLNQQAPITGVLFGVLIGHLFT